MLAIHLLIEITGSCVHANPDQTVKQLLQNTNTILKSMYITYIFSPFLAWNYVQHFFVETFKA